MDLNARPNYPLLSDSISLNKPRLEMPSNMLPYLPPPAAFSSSLYLTIPRRKTILGKVDDACFDGWVDSMKASSPPHKKLNIDSGPDASSEDNSAYLSWMLKFPSALTSFEQITNLAKGKRIVLFLDYDGTLSPIVNNPDHAFMSRPMRASVRRAAQHFPTAIISGRSRDKVFEFVRLTEVHYAGSHGMDIMGPVRKSESVDSHPNCLKASNKQGKDVHLFQPASKFIPMIDEVFRSLVSSTNGIKGVKVENNKFCASVHYRLVDEMNWPAVAKIVHDVLKDYPELRLTHGRKVLEVRPVINWNKGKAVEFLLESLGLSESTDVIPIFIGDDRTDEDAFKVLRDRNIGFGILVSSAPKETSASYSLKDPSEVLQFLKLLVKSEKSAL